MTMANHSAHAPARIIESAPCRLYVKLDSIREARLARPIGGKCRTGMVRNKLRTVQESEGSIARCSEINISWFISRPANDDLLSSCRRAGGVTNPFLLPPLAFYLSLLRDGLLRTSQPPPRARKVPTAARAASARVLSSSLRATRSCLSASKTSVKVIAPAL
jgi:hypothetical protein